MSTYNGAKYIEDQIKSILDQSISDNLVLRIRDDGSTDETCEIIENYQNRYPSKIELIRGNNIGVNASFFELINNAHGFDYYSLADQDDIWFLEKLEVAITKIIQREERERNIPLLYSSVSCIVKSDLQPLGVTRRMIKQFTLYNTIIQCICPGHTQVFNNKLLKIIQDDLIITARLYGYDQWIVNKAILYGDIIFENEYYTYYRQHQSNKFGTASTFMGRLLIGYRRIRKGEGVMCRKQIRYFMEKNINELKKQGIYDELYKFIKARTLLQRINYLFQSKLYRQNIFETLAFRIAVLMKLY